MDYEIYNLVYDLGILNFLESVVSASSHDRAKEMLENHLDENYFHKKDICKKMGFNVRIISSTGVRTNEEGVFSPFISRNLEEMISKISLQQ